MKGVLFMSVFLGMLGFSAAHAETIDVNLGKGKITAGKTSVEHGDFLNICSRDEKFHQPFSMGPSNKFGSSKAKEKDMLPKGDCRLIELKNKGPDVAEMRIQDRFMPEAALTLRVLPKPQAMKVKESATKSDLATEKEPAREREISNDPNKPVFSQPMQGKQRLAYCYAPEQGCGSKAADAWCQEKGYKGAQKWEVDPKENGKARSARYIGSDLTCKPGACDTFSSIMCRSGPPTFF